MFNKLKSYVTGKTMLLFTVIALFSVNMYAQDNANKVLKAVQDKFNSLSDFSAEVKQVAKGQSGLQGKFYFKKENKIRLELKNTTFVSNGETTWNYNKKDNRVLINENDASNTTALSMSTILNDYPAKSNVTASMDNGKNVITLTPKSNTKTDFSKVKLWINDNNLIDKVTVTQESGNTMTIEISDYRLNQNLADSQFSFSPPQGTTVIDLR